ncbi:hypothetical protein F5X99DRAFT_427863 [Biscogniauxia marginata]|nr:hypothetical protein F5X99DRAFT_427863 [Biscogniauxia marginata]
MQNALLYYATSLWLASGAYAARACGNSTTESSTYLWRVGDARYDGADTSQSNGSATVAVSIVPGNNTYATFFECVAEWPEPWSGWYEDKNIVWSDCIWAGNGPTYDTTVAFAMDWKNHTIYIAHTFDCSDRPGTDVLATGFIHFDMNCTEETDDSTSCMLPTYNDTSSLVITTKAAPARLDAGSDCADNSERYQSWQLENWIRQYELDPGYLSSSPATASPSDTGPSFTLRNMANTDIFDCSTSANQSNSTFDGTCKSEIEGDSASTTMATFRFDTELDILMITQTWNCSNT